VISWRTSGSLFGPRQRCTVRARSMSTKSVTFVYVSLTTVKPEGRQSDAQIALAVPAHFVTEHRVVAAQRLQFGAFLAVRFNAKR
jgi:hypothetical protein